MTSREGKDKAQRYIMLTMTPLEAKRLAMVLEVAEAFPLSLGITTPELLLARTARRHLEHPGVKPDNDGRLP